MAKKEKTYDVLTKYDRAFIGADAKSYKTCAKCGKKFYCDNMTRRNYAYKKKLHGGLERYYCSWSCFRSSNK